MVNLLHNAAQKGDEVDLPSLCASFERTVCEALRTRLFAAIESGAPVVNMLSAYGGIRWGSGLNRSMQYEHGQSRIGGNIWEMPLQYIENSPLFNMDKVTTPILIMHNDADGHVPWYQGIEYFIALKRLQKPAWLLNYTVEPHWPMRLANRIDFQKRMFQFFNHYPVSYTHLRAHET